MSEWKLKGRGARSYRVSAAPGCTAASCRLWTRTKTRQEEQNRAGPGPRAAAPQQIRSRLSATWCHVPDRRHNSRLPAERKSGPTWYSYLCRCVPSKLFVSATSTHRERHPPVSRAAAASYSLQRGPGLSGTLLCPLVSHHLPSAPKR